ncbi:hypothetical protein ACIBEJ_51375 [Nonomuraea sp. NPDC050790]
MTFVRIGFGRPTLGGRGLWIARTVARTVTVASAAGTRVTLPFALA